MTFSLRPGVRPAWACFLVAFSAAYAAATSEAGWRSAGPFGASVESVVFSGHERGDGQNLLAITSNAYLYRSRDGGIQWTLVRFPAQHGAFAHALTVDPHRAGSFLIGVSSSNPALAGLYQTTDDGATWKHVVREVAVFSAAFSPSDPSVIAAGSKTGVLLSRDSGSTWTPISPLENKELQPVMSLGFDPRDAKVLYAGTPHLPWKTSDGGQNWTSIHQGMIDDSDILALIVNQKKPDQLFIGACSGIYRSDNAATRWTKLLGITGAGFRTYAVALDPGQADIVYSGTRDGLWKSADLGRSWRKLAPNIVKAVAVSPGDSKTVIIATEDAGILRSADGGESFVAASQGLADRRMVRMVRHGRGMLVTLGKDASTLQATDPGSVNTASDWRRVRLPANAGGTPSQYQFLSHGAELLAYTGSSAWRSRDAGVNWKPLPVLPPGPIGLGVAGGAALIATPKAVFRLAPNELAWQPVTALGVSAGAIRRMWTSRSGSGPAWIEAGNSVWSTHDAGKNWAIASLPVRTSDIYEFDASSSMVWIATSNGLYRSRDSGKTWQLCQGGGLDGGSTTPAVAVHPVHPLEAFAAQFGRIFRTLDGGDSWYEVPVEGLDGATIAALAVSDDPQRQNLVALTPARGVFVHELKALDSSLSPAGGIATTNQQQQ